MAFRLKPSKTPTLRENDVETACLHVLALRGYWVGRNHCGTFKSADNRRWIKGHPKGTPDYVCMKGPQGFLLEAKRPGAKTSPEQDQKHYELRQFFRLTIVTVDCVEQLIAWLDEHERAG